MTKADSLFQTENSTISKLYINVRNEFLLLAMQTMWQNRTMKHKIFCKMLTLLIKIQYKCCWIDQKTFKIIIKLLKLSALTNKPAKGIKKV